MLQCGLLSSQRVGTRSSLDVVNNLEPHILSFWAELDEDWVTSDSS